MIKIEHIAVSGWDAAIRGMRNPMNSWSNSDSTGDEVGEKDLKLMKRLYKAGPEHCKFLRMIRVSFDLTAPLYMLKEMDTYKIGTNCNSTSTMHKIMEKKFDMDDFAHEHLTSFDDLEWLAHTVKRLNELRSTYLNWVSLYDHDISNLSLKKAYTSKKEVWYALIQTLPSGYLQKRTYEMSLQTLMRILSQRKNHKLDEWNEFCKIFEEEIPIISLLKEE